MKKQIIFLATALSILFVFTACNQGSVKTKFPTMKTEIDSLNYAFGLANGSDLRMMMAQDSDSVDYKVARFIAGIREGLSGKVSKYPEIEQVGGQVGGWLAHQKESGLMGDSTLTLDFNLIKQGLINAILDEKVNLTSEQSQEYLNNVMTARQERKLENQYGAIKKEGEKFLAENKTKENINTTESGLQYEVIRLGKGAKPTATDKVKVHYEGKLLNDTIFDSSYKRGEPIDFEVGQVIKGWTEALQLMPVGSKFKLYIPQDLAYGANENNPSIPPFSTLVFDVELLEILK